MEEGVLKCYSLTASHCLFLLFSRCFASDLFLLDSLGSVLQGPDRAAALLSSSPLIVWEIF